MKRSTIGVVLSIVMAFAAVASPCFKLVATSCYGGLLGDACTAMCSNNHSNPATVTGLGSYSACGTAWQGEYGATTCSVDPSSLVCTYNCQIAGFCWNCTLFNYIDVKSGSHMNRKLGSVGCNGTERNPYE